MAWLPLVAVVCGCGASATQAVSGVVTLDGAPLPSGQIEFTPIDGTSGPTAGAQIEDGRYEVPAVAQGLRTGGVYKVAITSMAGSGEWIAHPNEPSGKREALKNIIPARYNEQSELKATIDPDVGGTTQNFDLSSEPA